MARVTVRFPAEWEPHAATLLTWPWDESIWGVHHAGAVESIARAAGAVARGERVVVHVPDAEHGEQAADAISAAGGNLSAVDLVVLPSDDVWVRDHGPTLVVHRDGLRGVDWNFNAWGGKFPHERDTLIATRAAARLGAQCDRATIVLEGGALETDGDGTVICTRSVALSDTRNPGVSESAIEQELRRLLGCRRVIWLEEGMACDDTDGHADTLARFAPGGRLLVHVMGDPRHPDAAPLAANHDQLDRDGRWHVTPVPAPTLRAADGSLLPASYVNFYVANAVVLVPQYGAPEDAAALAVVSEAFPDRVAVPLDCTALVTQGGAIHCATQQVPRLPR